MIKLTMPFLLGLFLTLTSYKLSLMQAATSGQKGSFHTLLDEQAALTIAFAAAIFAFLMAWPYILLWDFLIDPLMYPYRTLFFISYIAYIVAFAFFALSGSETARALTQIRQAPNLSWTTLGSGLIANR
ncbi:hypothetical protein PUT78_22930 [Roseinatronobacter sp. HJB301]|uniref:Uncharacterized protein n=1 Tax=Roseinatronobacter alkalisoli TaxID=3028235 RepID=A0ABT5TFI3_9RHOB|nr:hypothetical protein [Roseinatronobacter sp. HJB301]